MLQLRRIYSAPKIASAAYSSRNRETKPNLDSRTSTTYLKKLMKERIRDRNLDKATEHSDKISEKNDMGVFAMRYFSQNEKEILQKFPNLKGAFAEKIISEQTKDLIEENECENSSFDFPYGEKHRTPVETASSTQNVAEYSSPSYTGDRGFYVKSGKFIDHYIEGTATEIPNELDPAANPDKSRSLKTEKPHQRTYGPVESTESIDFQLPGQSSSMQPKEELSNEDSDAWRIRYGKADPTIPPSDKNCLGCGAQFHCQDSALPGFLPLELFRELSSVKSPTEPLCRRCYLLKHHDFLLNVNVSPVDYRKVMGTLRFKQEALIVLLVDMLDFPGSVFRDLPSLVGSHKPLMVVGNKVDLLPPSAAPGYIRHFRRTLREEVEKLGFHKQFNLINTQLISAKTGFGVEDLITRIQTRWGSRGDIYLVGCTNTGKSTLFNTFLQSDLCKILASDLVERATTSIWPGTTLSLLKFPVLNPVPHRLRARFQRLKSAESTNLEDRVHRKMAFDETGNNEYAVLQGLVGKSFFNQELEKPRRITSTAALGVAEELKNREFKKKFDPEHPDFKSGKWCHDTPGTVNEDQIINQLTLEELVNVLPKKIIQPRTVNLREDDILLVGGLARLKHLRSTEERRKIMRATVFASTELPIHAVPESRLHLFLGKYLGTPSLGAPLGGKSRLKLLPKQKSSIFSVIGGGINLGIADIVLSSIGWVTVCGLKDGEYTIEASTPGGVGIFKRDSPLFPLNLHSGYVPSKKRYRRKKNHVNN